MPDVRGVGIAVVVRERVVLAVIGHPVEHGTLHRHRAEHGERVAHRRDRVEGAMGEEAVVADRDADGGGHVHRGEDREVGPAHHVVPQQHDRGERRDERQDHGGEVHSSLEF
jgi:hypothetical protein